MSCEVIVAIITFSLLQVILIFKRISLSFMIRFVMIR